MGCHVGTYLYKKEYGKKAHDELMANPFRIDYYLRFKDPELIYELMKIQTTLLYSSTGLELGVNLGALAFIGRIYEITMGRTTLMKLYLLNSLVTTICFIPGVLRHGSINMNTNYNKYSTTFSMSLITSYYFLNNFGHRFFKIACLVLYIYLIFNENQYDFSIGTISGIIANLAISRRFFHII